MSRHVIPNTPGSPDNRVTTVGWDPPLTTFFAMAFDGDDEVFWIGMDPSELPTLGALTDALANHYGVTVPDDVLAQLVADKHGEGDRSSNVGRRLVDAIRAQQDGAES